MYSLPETGMDPLDPQQVITIDLLSSEPMPFSRSPGTLFASLLIEILQWDKLIGASAAGPDTIPWVPAGYIPYPAASFSVTGRVIVAITSSFTFKKMKNNFHLLLC